MCYRENKAAVEPRRDAAAETSRNAAVETNRDAAVETRESPQNEVKVETVSLRLLKLAGVVPLVSLASHTHYIIIAWITDPLYATGVGINYVIFYVIHLVVLKQSCKRTIQCYDALPKYLKVYCIVVLPTVAVWLVSLSLQILVTVFFVYIPINYSIEDTLSTLLTIIQGVIVLILGLIAWKVIVDPRGKEPLATISGALRMVIKKKDPNREIKSDQWVRFDDEKKLAEVLHHVIKINTDQSQGDTSRGTRTEGNTSQDT